MELEVLMQLLPNKTWISYVFGICLGGLGDMFGVFLRGMWEVLGKVSASFGEVTQPCCKPIKYMYTLLGESSSGFCWFI